MLAVGCDMHEVGALEGAQQALGGGLPSLNRSTGTPGGDHRGDFVISQRQVRSSAGPDP